MTNGQMFKQAHGIYYVAALSLRSRYQVKLMIIHATDTHYPSTCLSTEIRPHDTTGAENIGQSEGGK